MVRCRQLLLLGCVLVLPLLPMRAAVLLHEFALRGTLDDRLSSTSLTAVGGQITAIGYVAVQGQGLLLNSPALNPAGYSVEFSFRLNSSAGDVRLLDLHNLADTSGLYQLNGQLAFVPTVTSVAAPLPGGQDTHVIFTRDSASGVAAAYLNGQLAFSFVDTSGVAIVSPAGTLNFFRTPSANTLPGSNGGTLTSIRIYNGALSAAEVSNLYVSAVPLPVPEPSVIGLLLTGLGAAAVLWRRRQRP